MNCEADRALGRLAGANSGIFTRDDALAAGIPASTVASRLRSGIWVAEHGRGLRAATTPLTIAARERAALAHLGDHCVLSHFSAARHWRLGTTVPNEVWVTVPARRRPARVAGVRVVRSRHTGEGWTRLPGTVPVMSPARTVADLALVLDRRQLTAIALAAMQRGLCELDDLLLCQQTLTGRPGSHDLRTALAEADPAFESILSAEFGALLAHGQIELVPRYVLVLPDGSEVVCDFADPEARIDFEVDGLAFHSTPEQVTHDKARDRRLLAAGWVSVRYGTDDVRRYPQRTLLDVRRQQAARNPARRR